MSQTLLHRAPEAKTTQELTSHNVQTSHPECRRVCSCWKTLWAWMCALSVYGQSLRDEFVCVKSDRDAHREHDVGLMKQKGGYGGGGS